MRKKTKRINDILNFLVLKTILKKSCKGNISLGKKKPPNIIRVLRKKTEKTDKSFEKVIGYMTKNIFLLLEKTRLKTS